MNDDNLRQIAQAALNVLRPMTSQSQDKMVTVHFAPTDKYADCFIRSFRKGTGFLGLGAPAIGSPIVSLDIAITLKPGVMTQQWVGYTIDIKNPETTPELTLSGEWPEAGGTVAADPSKLEQVVPHILALLAGPLAPGNTPSPRQSPETMY